MSYQLASEVLFIGDLFDAVGALISLVFWIAVIGFILVAAYLWLDDQRGSSSSSGSSSIGSSSSSSTTDTKPKRIEPKPVKDLNINNKRNLRDEIVDE